MEKKLRENFVLYFGFLFASSSLNVDYHRRRRRSLGSTESDYNRQPPIYYYYVTVSRPSLFLSLKYPPTFPPYFFLMAAAAANRQLGPDAWTSELASLLISTVPYLSLETHKTAVPTISNNDDDRRKKKTFLLLKIRKKKCGARMKWLTYTYVDGALRMPTWFFFLISPSLLFPARSFRSF